MFTRKHLFIYTSKQIFALYCIDQYNNWFRDCIHSLVSHCQRNIDHEINIRCNKSIFEMKDRENNHIITIALYLFVILLWFLSAFIIQGN